MAEGVLLLSERFYSIQGESTWVGLPCLFIRLSGCNLRCTYCDARYTWNEEGKPWSHASLLAWIDSFPGIPVEFTGGEPLIQAGVYPLMRDVLARGRTVLLETNGSLALDEVPDGVHIIMDVKCPDSGMMEHNRPENLALLRERARRGCRDEIKFVLSSEADFHWARQQVEQLGADHLLPVLFSPVQPLLPPAELARLLLAHRLPVRLQLQLHTLLWPGRDRGV
ncbi:MAG: 7-carboxy-7-deazaguanine synthase QueE [Desulfobulbus sp.]|jgi:7-carboxy-7-deazaguanine synthase